MSPVYCARLASDRTLWRAKNSDSFKPMGPWIETDADLDAMVTTIRLNGQVAETFKTNNMISTRRPTSPRSAATAPSCRAT
jgi:2-keto-4-pentenoate hydratase/2-oxohepta-3-ene-1,7-dioic acid hydratase in catechol pathway